MKFFEKDDVEFDYLSSKRGGEVIKL